MMRKGALILAVITAPAVDGFSFLKDRRTQKTGMVTLTSRASPGVEYAGPTEACCGCIKARALAKTDGAPKQCGTCYTADTWQVEGRKRETEQVGGSVTGMMWDVKSPPIWGFSAEEGTLESCRERAKKLGLYLVTSLGGRRCNGVKFEDNEESALIPMVKAEVPYWLKFLSGKTVINVKTGEVADYPAYDDMEAGHGIPGMGGEASGGKGSGGYEVITSKQESIHQWHWTCSDGYAPTDKASWAVPAVEGEPPSRDLYHMCAEPEGIPIEEVIAACDGGGLDSDEPVEITSFKMPITSSPWK